MRALAAAFLATALAALVSAGRGSAADERPRTAAWAAEALRSPDPSVRAEAASFLGAREDPAGRSAAVVALIPRLDDPHPLARRSVVNALVRLREGAVGRCLASRLERESDPEVTAALLVGLGALGGGEPVVARVLPFAGDSRVPVRAAALTALGDLGGETARGAVLRALEDAPAVDPEWSLRAAALLALARCGRPGDVRRALALVQEGDGWRHWFARSAVARLVAALDPDPLPMLRRLVEDADPRVAVTAADGLGRRGGPDEVARLLDHARADVRAAGVAAVGRLPLAPLVPRLRAMARADASRPVRWAAARELFRIADPLGDELVLEGVTANEPVVWSEAVALLSERTGSDLGRDVAAWREALARARRGR